MSVLLLIAVVLLWTLIGLFMYSVCRSAAQADQRAQGAIQGWRNKSR